jgi:xylulokinase
MKKSCCTGNDPARLNKVGGQAVLEGVAFAIRDSVEIARSLGIEVNSSKICGGGAKSPLWKKIIANVLGVKLESPACEQGPGMGGAMLAMVACGEYASVQAACDAIVKTASVLEPDAELTALYETQYQKFKAIYPALKAVYPVLR